MIINRLFSIIIFLGFQFSQVDAQDIVINEFLAGSDTCCGADIFDGNTEDFVELYNNGLDSIESIMFSKNDFTFLEFQL